MSYPKTLVVPIDLGVLSARVVLIFLVDPVVLENIGYFADDVIERYSRRYKSN